MPKSVVNEKNLDINKKKIDLVVNINLGGKMLW